MKRPEFDFDGKVSATFFSDVMRVASKHHGRVVVSIEDMELLRKACAVVEAVATGAFAEQPADESH